MQESEQNMAQSHQWTKKYLVKIDQNNVQKESPEALCNQVAKQNRGSFNNHVDKIRGVGGPKLGHFCPRTE